MNTYLARFARRVATIVADCNYAQRRMLSLQTAIDPYLTDPDKAPEDYAEFLLRTSGVLPHEPTASRRIHGQPVG